MRIQYLIERENDSTDVRSFWGTAEQYEQIGGNNHWNILHRFVQFDEPLGEWFQCDNYSDTLYIKLRIASREIERLDQKLEDLRR